MRSSMSNPIPTWQHINKNKLPTSLLRAGRPQLPVLPKHINPVDQHVVKSVHDELVRLKLLK